ncbi:MAG: hypothetical protein AMXMBFR84_16780 [Candidatus Hydrogenedentota bacterium]
MNVPPAYFDAIESGATVRWNQLESDPVLAAPWHQLFRQVQLPRHVVSELLQNADDAGATEATVRIQDGSFEFTHNGEDFTDQQFSSLCRFGYSNKRTLHTIGFRGIGFKSLFSLGPEVHLQTPTLSVQFQKHRFTQPIWDPDTCVGESYNTVIRVPLQNGRIHDVENNFREWLNNPLSLLFFRSIRKLTIGTMVIKWQDDGLGPVPNSKWVRLNGDDTRYLLINSVREPFPDNAKKEILDERSVDQEVDAQLLACEIQLVCGLPGRLYVVLPTDVTPDIPFAVNAPFIQDPARMGIKDPEISPTNRWLLQRAGVLAGQSTLGWLGNFSISVKERANAYCLVPTCRNDSGIDGTCASIVADSFQETVNGQLLLLDDNGNLQQSKKCFGIPTELFEIWDGKEITRLFDNGNRPPLSRYVSLKSRDWLMAKGYLESRALKDVFTALMTASPAKPDSWHKLLRLWTFILPELRQRRYDTKVADAVRLVPVRGVQSLLASEVVVRMGETPLISTENGWALVNEYVKILDGEWLSYIKEPDQDEMDDSQATRARVAREVLEIVHLDRPTPKDKVINLVGDAIVRQKSAPKEHVIRIGRIAAEVEAKVDEQFPFLVRSGITKQARDGLYCAESNGLMAYMPPIWLNNYALHEEYLAGQPASFAQKWKDWIESGHARAFAFPPLRCVYSQVYKLIEINEEIRRRGDKTDAYTRFSTHEYRLTDWDFDDELWTFWRECATTDDRVWNRLGTCILSQRIDFWKKSMQAVVQQVTTAKNWRDLSWGYVTPLWIHKLKQLPCLPDTRGNTCKPYELLLRNAETEALIDIESFVDSHLDTEQTRPLLKKLGVQDKGNGPERLLDLVRVFMNSSDPPRDELCKWYRRLDLMASNGSTSDQEQIRRAFQSEALVFTSEHGWVTTANAYVASADDDVPDAPLVLSGARDLSLWSKVGVAERPTVERAIGWLGTLPSRSRLSRENLHRVKALMARHPSRVWVECGHWLNLCDEWVPTGAIQFGLYSDRKDCPDLFPPFLGRIGDFGRVHQDVLAEQPFSQLPSIGRIVEFHLDSNVALLGEVMPIPWLNQFGYHLQRLDIGMEDDDASRIAQLTTELSNAMLVYVEHLSVVPYVDDVPAGPAEQHSLVWKNGMLYVTSTESARLAKLVPEVLGKQFGREDFAMAMSYCYERQPNEIRAYLEENFKLLPEVCDRSAEPETVRPELNVEAIDPVDGFSVDRKVIDLESVLGVELILGDGDLGEIHPDDTVEELEGLEDTADPDPRPTRKQAASVPLIENFLIGQGFVKDNGGRFVRSDGTFVAKNSEHIFPWEWIAKDGSPTQYYLASDKCLETEAVELTYEQWGMISNEPDSHNLVLSDRNDRPTVLTGTKLMELKKQGMVELFPATYRLCKRNSTRNECF